MSISNNGELHGDNTQSIIDQLIEQDLGYCFGVDDEEDSDEVFSWDEKEQYRVLTNGIYYIVFLDIDKTHELYKDAINWHPSYEEFHEKFTEQLFKKALEQAYNGQTVNLSLMLDSGNTGTVDEWDIAIIDDKKQILYFFNI